jgi:hypothetical protein
MTLQKLNTENISLHQDVMESQSFKDIFLKNWPMCVIALDALEGVIKNPIVKFVIGIVESAGQAIYDQLSKP